MKFKIQYSIGGSLEPTPTEVQFSNYDSLRKAVNEWLNNESDAIQKYGHISNWNVSQVTDMDYMFYIAETFNHDISKWDVSQVTTMENMFAGCRNFNQDISGWDVSSVTDMHGMFSGATSFNQYIGQWDVSQVRNMSGMFRNATAFNQDIGQWNVSQVRNMSSMFEMAAAFNQDIGKWPIRRGCHVNAMFYKSGMSAETFKGIYGSRIADYFKFNNPNQDAVMEPYTRWERRKNVVKLMSGLNKKGTLSTPEEELRRILDSEGPGRKIASYLGGSKN